MSDVKIEIRIGQIHFTGEGNQDWIAKQLDKIIEKADKLVRLAPPAQCETGNAPGIAGGDTASIAIAKKTLPAFLDAKKARSNQTKKFLVTSVWLHAKGQEKLKTRDVTAALKSANQSRIGNAADCLNKNVNKGYCEKDGDQFFVTDEGRQSL